MRVTICTLAAVVTVNGPIATATDVVPAPRTASGLGCPDIEGLAASARSENPAEARAAHEALRSLGPMGLDLLVEQYADDLDAFAAWQAAPAGRPAHPAWARMTAALDAVGAQRDNFAARLYWHTSLDAALAEARRTGRPVLSLRLLGRLDEDLSCANSRFFRTALYSNHWIARILHNRFVLHWQSVRPVPRITIDFGDGRSMCRTITGNSLHHALDELGRPLDALPGLVAPSTFMGWLDQVARLHAQTRQATEADRVAAIAGYHSRGRAALIGDWARDLFAAGVQLEPLGADQGHPDAMVAAPIAVTKAMVELPLLMLIRADPRTLEDVSSATAWAAIAERHVNAARLDEGSLGVMARKTAVTPAMIDRFERAIALDDVRNQYLLHRVIHEWFIGGEVATHETLTERIYAELFLTPSSDPWLGLLPAETYAALDDNGVVGSQAAPR